MGHKRITNWFVVLVMVGMFVGVAESGPVMRNYFEFRDGGVTVAGMPVEQPEVERRQVMWGGFTITNSPYGGSTSWGSTSVSSGTLEISGGSGMIDIGGGALTKSGYGELTLAGDWEFGAPGNGVNQDDDGGSENGSYQLEGESGTLTSEGSTCLVSGGMLSLKGENFVGVNTGPDITLDGFWPDNEIMIMREGGHVPLSEIMAEWGDNPPTDENGFYVVDIEGGGTLLLNPEYFDIPEPAGLVVLVVGGMMVGRRWGW